MPEEQLQPTLPEHQQYAGEDEVIPANAEYDPYGGNEGHSIASPDAEPEQRAEEPTDAQEVTDSST